MTPATARPPISRVLVELGVIPDGDRVIGIACDLAAAIQAELHGLLVEDEALDDLSGLPFAHTVLPGRARPEALNPELLRQAYERQAASCRRTLSARAGGSQVTWSLDTARGHGTAEFLARISRSDLVVLQQHSLGQSIRDLIGQARSAAVVASGVVLIGRRIGRNPGRSSPSTTATRPAPRPSPLPPGWHAVSAQAWSCSSSPTTTGPPGGSRHAPWPCSAAYR